MKSKIKVIIRQIQKQVRKHLEVEGHFLAKRSILKIVYLEISLQLDHYLVVNNKIISQLQEHCFPILGKQKMRRQILNPLLEKYRGRIVHNQSKRKQKCSHPAGFLNHKLLQQVVQEDCSVQVEQDHYLVEVGQEGCSIKMANNKMQIKLKQSPHKKSLEVYNLKIQIRQIQNLQGEDCLVIMLSHLLDKIKILKRVFHYLVVVE